MSDLIERLRMGVDTNSIPDVTDRVMNKAADALEARDAEIARLTSSWESCEVKREEVLNEVARLRAALEEKDKELTALRSIMKLD